MAARSDGIGTVADLADYHRVSVRSARIALAELVEGGEVSQVRVRGWNEPAFLPREARIPRRVTGSALLGPFDPLIWARERTERLFDTRYRIEIYTPAAQRQYGYYVLPAGRRADRRSVRSEAVRATGQLLVQASWSEEGSDPAVGADAAAMELVRMAGWLGLDEAVVLPRGDLWSTLAARSGMQLGSARRGTGWRVCGRRGPVGQGPAGQGPAGAGDGETADGWRGASAVTVDSAIPGSSPPGSLPG